MPAFPKPTATETDPVAGPNLTTHTALTTTAHGGIVASSEKGAANGVATLDGSGRLPASQQTIGVFEYQGTWNASTNSPALADGTGTKGFLYRVTTAGSRNLGSGSITFDVGDYVIHNGTAWEKADTTDAVSSVNGRTGAVTGLAEQTALDAAVVLAGTNATAITAETTRATAAEALAGPGVTAYGQRLYNHKATTALRTNEAKDAYKWVERWPVTFDRGAGGWNCRSDVGVGSGGKLYAGAFVANLYNMERRLPFTSGRGRVAFQLDFKHDTSARFVKWAVHSESAPVADGSAAASLIECTMQQQAAGNASLSVAASGGPTVTSFNTNFPTDLPTGVYQCVIDIDDSYITFSVTPSDGSWEFCQRVTMPSTRPTYFLLYPGDGRGATTGTAIGPVVAVGAKATVSGAISGVEDGGHKVACPLMPQTLDRSRIAYPPNYDASVAAPLVIYCHGAGSNSGYADSNQRPIFQALQAAGFIVADGIFGDSGTLGTVGSPSTAEGPSSGYFNWGSDQALDRMVDLYRFIRDRSALGPVAFLGVSMGGLLSFLHLADTRIPNVCGVVGLQPVTNLANMFAGGYATSIKTVYSIKSDGSDYATRTAGHDPNTLAAASFRKVPIYLRGSASDTVVSKTNNMDALATTLTAGGFSVTKTTATGDHGDASEFSDTSGITSFLTACVAAGGI